MRVKCPNCSEEIKVFKTVTQCPNCSKEFTPDLVRCPNCDTLCRVGLTVNATIVYELGNKTEISMMKQFMETFNTLYSAYGKDVEENILINELIGTGKFNEEGSKVYIRKAMHNGQIYERRSGFYAKA